MFYLECTHLAKFYGKTEVFRGLNFQLGDARCIGIQGPNGSGKSTLMKCLSGLLRPSEGSIRWEIGGNSVRNQDLRFFAGFAAPYIHLYNELNVRENLSFLRQLRPGSGRSLPADIARCLSPDGPPPLEEVLAMAAITDLAGREFGTLSSGQQQRVRLAGALIADPPILMLDEPGTNLDADGTSLVAEIVTRHRQRGGLTFLSSNREEELALTGTRILLTSGNYRDPVPRASSHAS